MKNDCKPEWIKELKIGDEVITVERTGSMELRTKSAVTAIEDSYIETTFTREYNPAWHIYDRVDEDENPYNRAYFEIIQRNYFNPITGEINIEKL